MKHVAIKFLTIVLLAFLAFSCKDYDAEFAQIQERIEKLQAADAQTRKMILAEMDRLSNEILDRIAQMEKEVYKYLDDAVVRLTDKILDASDKIHKKISDGSARLGTSIRDWDRKINGLIDDKESDFRKGLSLMETEFGKARKDGDAALQRRINNGISQLKAIQNDFPARIESMGKKFSKIQDVADKYTLFSDKISSLNSRKEAMKGTVEDYRARLEDVMSKNIKEFSSGQMQSLYEEILDAYSTLDGLENEISSMSDDIEYYYSNAPDVEDLLSEAENAFAEMDDLESAISSFDTDYVVTLLDDIQAAYAAADECDITLDDVQSKADYYLGFVNEGISAFDEYNSTIEGYVDDLDYRLSILETDF